MKVRGIIRAAAVFVGIMTCSLIMVSAGAAEPVIEVTELGAISLQKNILWSPGRLALGGDGTLYVVDSYKNHILAIDRTGIYQGDIFVPQVAAVAVGPDGTLYVGSHRDYSVAIYRNGETAGYLGSGAHEFSSIRDIAVDTETGDVYVADNAGNAVRVYDRQGQPLGSVGGINLPTGVTVAEGEIYIIDNPVISDDLSTGARISVFDRAFNLVMTINEYGNETQLFRPTDLAVSDGILYISDAALNAVAVFDAGGRYAGEIRSGGAVTTVPVGLVVSGDGTLYVSESQTRSIQRFGISITEGAGAMAGGN